MDGCSLQGSRVQGRLPDELYTIRLAHSVVLQIVLRKPDFQPSLGDSLVSVDLADTFGRLVM